MGGRRLFGTVALFAALLGLLLLAVKWDYTKPGPLSSDATLVLPKGRSSFDLGKELREAGVIESSSAFVIAAHLNHGGRLKAGEYAFQPHMPLSIVVAMIQQGRVVVHHLTVPEGLTNSEISALIAEEPALSGEVGLLPAEGTLLPETYNFLLGDSRSGLIMRMHEAAAHALEAAWMARDREVNLQNRQQALRLASIVEKETGLPDERPKVAAVFLNRLKRDMKLQADPTVIYALTQGNKPLDRSLTHQDLSISSPFNTYLIEGLPPSPICNPGKASLNAVLHPDSHPYLYFVANGSGGHAFAETLDEHNRNVANWLRYLHEHAP